MDIVLIDDEVNVREPLAMHLSDRGHQIRTAGTGEEGLWLLEERPAELVISDIKMPGMSGLEVLRRVRERWPATEVVLVTGYGTMDDAVEALRLGAYDFLLKPIRLARLDLLVNHCEERIRFSRDNRELREVVERLRELNERKEKFTALANHEIRTPTTVASGLVSLLAERVATLPEPTRKLVTEADKALRRLKEVVEDLSDLGRALAGDLQIYRRGTSAGDLVVALESVCSMYRSVRNLGVAVVDATGAPGELWIDDRKIVRAAAALVQNGVKYTRDGGRVWIDVSVTDGELVLAVHDTGVGVEPGEAEKIFDLFYEAAEVRHHRTSPHEFGGGGLGVGLPLARVIAAAHGGNLAYEPHAEGPGSQFTLRIPCTPPHS